MFPALRTEISDRFSSIESYFKALPRSPLDVDRTSKGIAFVMIYGAYEYTIRKGTEAAILQLSGTNLAVCSLRPSLLALFLDAKIKSIRDVGEDKQWDKRIGLFEEVFSSSYLPNVAAIPHDGSQFSSYATADDF